jgi:hypothetical protein
MDAPTKATKAAVAAQNALQAVMDELTMTESTTAESTVPEKSTSFASNTATSTEACPALATELNDFVMKRRPTSCGNERYLKNAGRFKTCVKKAMKACPTCGLVEVIAAEILMRGEAVAAYEVIAVYEAAAVINFVTFMNLITIRSPLT